MKPHVHLHVSDAHSSVRGEKKKRQNATPPAKHLLRLPLLNDFTRCASKCQPLAFRGSLCDNSRTRYKGYRR